MHLCLKLCQRRTTSLHESAGMFSCRLEAAVLLYIGVMLIFLNGLLAVGPLAAMSCVLLSLLSLDKRRFTPAVVSPSFLEMKGEGRGLQSATEITHWTFKFLKKIMSVEELHGCVFVVVVVTDRLKTT